MFDPSIIRMVHKMIHNIHVILEHKRANMLALVNRSRNIQTTANLMIQCMIHITYDQTTFWQALMNIFMSST